MRFAPILLAAGISLVPALAPRAAQACAAPFYGPTSDKTTVSGHKVAFAISPERTVLWHQLAFDGPPGEFSWVLPVKKGAYLESSTDAWFEALDAFTSTRVYEIEPVCAEAEPDESGCSSDSSSEVSAGGGQVAPPTVTVVHHGSVGPYETVTLSSTDPKALESWLEKHGYVVPDAVRPIIADYVAEGFDFIALRLLPGAGAEAMTPVRVITPGGDPELPMRLAGTGAGERVPMTLYVIGTARYAIPSLQELVVPTEQLVWDYAAGSSNYAALRGATLAKAEGASYITPFAARDAFRITLQTPSSGTASFNAGDQPSYWGGGVQRLGELYFAQARANEDSPTSCVAALAALDYGLEVINDCDPVDPTKCDPLNAAQVSKQELECEKWTDLAAALVGMAPGDVWLTRLELELSQNALKVDRKLAPHATQTTVVNQLSTENSVNPPCRGPLFTGSNTALAFGSLFGLWLGRRGSRRRTRPE